MARDQLALQPDDQRNSTSKVPDPDVPSFCFMFAVTAVHPEVCGSRLLQVFPLQVAKGAALAIPAGIPNRIARMDITTKTRMFNSMEKLLLNLKLLAIGFYHTHSATLLGAA
ncbi:MAG: hypothetical protein WA821_14150 [Anaerolineales bacterium]